MSSSGLKKIECPSCAMEVPADSRECPVCGYEFTHAHPAGRRWLAILLIVAMLMSVVYYLVG